jgi:hypothetical protein
VQIFLVSLAIVALSSLCIWVLVRRAVRAARRKIARLGDRARLTARAHGVGPSAEVARLRREMARSLDGASRALAAARAVQSPVGDVPSLLARLELAARAVDGELRVLEAQRDGARITTQLAGPRSRAAVITSSTAHLVDGLLQAAGHDAEELSLLEAACAIEADALRSLVEKRSAAQRMDGVAGWASGAMTTIEPMSPAASPGRLSAWWSSARGSRD